MKPTRSRSKSAALFSVSARRSRCPETRLPSSLRLMRTGFAEIEEGYASGKGRGPSVRVLERAANAVGLTLTLSRK